MEEEIRRIQSERKKAEDAKNGTSFKEVAFDTDFYGGPARDKSSFFDTSIAVDDNEAEEEEHQYAVRKFVSEKKTFLNSFTGSSSLFDDTRQIDKDFDPFQDFKRKTVAEREDDYRAQWRKRKLSPPRLDPFNAKNNQGVKETDATSYKEIMMDVQLEKERKEILHKIEEKKKAEKEEKKKEERRRQYDEEERRKKEKKRKKEGRSPSPPSTKRTPEKKTTGWTMSISKRGEKLGTLHLDVDMTINFGREASNDVRLDHESCSKKHAKLTFISGRPNLMDLRSTNGTKLNGQDMVAGEYYKLSDGDKIRFGESTREFIVNENN